MSLPRKSNGSIYWDGIIQKGENPNGMMSQTADSTVRNCDALGPQEHHWNQNADGPRWNSGFQPKMGEVVTTAPSRRKRR